MKNYVKNDFVIDKTIVVNFNGGEALLNKDFIKEAVEQFKTNEIYDFSLSTNFMLLDKDFMLFLIDNNFTVQISIDGKQSTHDLNRIDFNGNGIFDKVFNNLKLFKQLGADNILLSMVFTPETVRYLSENIKYLIDLGYYNIISSFNDRVNWSQEDIKILKRQAKKIRKLYIWNFLHNKPVYIKILSLEIENFLYGKSGCGCCKDLIGILPEGNVIACGAFIGNKEKEEMFKIGSIYSDKLNINLINKILNWKCECSECNNCKFEKRCRNDCIACNYDSTGNIYCPSSANCEISKIFIKESDKTLIKLIKNSTFKNYYSKCFRGEK